MPLHEAVSSFLLALKADGMRPKTIDWYQEILTAGPHSPLRWLASHGAQTLQQVTTNLLRQFVVWLREQPHARTGAPLSEHTINCYLRALHKFWAWSAEEWEIVNPMKRIAYPKMAEARPKAIALRDFSAMFAACDESPTGTRNRALMAFMLDTGCRAGGVCGLTTERLDLDGRRALVTEKGNKTRIVIFRARTAELLSQWLAVRAPVQNVFHHMRSGGRLTPSGLRQILKKIARRAGVTGRVNPHSFRHAFAREYLRNGGDLATLSRLMGHNQTATTVEYYTLFTEDEIQAAHERYSPMSRLAV